MRPIQQNRPARRVLAAALCLLLLAGGVPAQAASRETIQTLTRQQQDLRRERSGLEQSLRELGQEEDQALSRKGLLEQKINVLSQEIQVSQQRIDQLGQEITEKEAELARAQAEEANYDALLRQRLRAMEERGRVSYWQVLFQVESFSDLLDRMNVVAEVAAYDRQVMDGLTQARQTVAQAKTQLESDRQQKQAALNEQQDQRRQLRTEQGEVEALLGQIQRESGRYSRQIQALEATEDQVARDLVQAEATYARQLEAERQAEQARQEQARQAAERARQQAAAQSRQAAAQSQQAAREQAPSGGAAPGQHSGLSWPVPGYQRISSPFGMRVHPIGGQYSFHRGIDIPAPQGTPVIAAQGGVVVLSRYQGSYGNYVVLSHPDGMRTLYAHLSSRSVSAGEVVSQGETVGLVGSTGNSTGPHLHYETWTGSSASSRVDPMNYY